jgi:hypothetical protein
MTPAQADFLKKHGPYTALTADQIDFLVRKGEWLVNAFLLQTPMEQGLGATDANVFAGQGVPDLDKLAQLFVVFPWSRFYVDVGGPDSFTESVLVGPDDLTAWRSHYIAVWGTVSRPQYWAEDVQTINGSQSIGVSWP